MFEDPSTYTLRLVAHTHTNLVILTNEQTSPEVIIHSHTGSPWEMHAPTWAQWDPNDMHILHYDHDVIAHLMMSKVYNQENIEVRSSSLCAVFCVSANPLQVRCLNLCRQMGHHKTQTAVHVTRRGPIGLLPFNTQISD